jgi:hypothetical protein
MDLVRNIADIKKWANTNATFSPATLEPAANQVKGYLIDIMGINEYNELVSAYGGNTDNTTNAQKALLPYAQRALVSLAMMEHFTSGLAEVSDSGAHLSQSKDRKGLPSDLRKEIQKSYQDKGFEALEQLLLFLQSSPSNTYPGWEASPEKAEHLRLFINSAKDFDRYYDIGKNFRLFLALRSTILDVESKYILPILGRQLFNQLKTAILNRNTSPQQKELIQTIQAAVAPMAIYHGIPKHADKFTDAGLIQNAQSMNYKVDIYEPSNPSIISLRIRDAEKQGMSAMNALEKFLRDNAANYPLYEVVSSPMESINAKDKKTFIAF